MAKTTLKLLLMMLLSLFFGTLLILFLYPDPSKGITYFLLKPLDGFLFTGNTLNRASLFMISGTAIMFSFQGGEFNLGGEGQICFGGLMATLFLLKFSELGSLPGVFAAMIVAVLAGMALGALSAYLKNRHRISEVISTYMISMGVIELSRYLINGPFKDENSFLITTQTIKEKFFLPLLLSPSQLNITLFVALLVVGTAYLYLYHTPYGFDWRLAGVNSAYARYCGINIKNHTMRVLVISGGINGFAGGMAILGTHHRALQDFFSGLGWNGMALSLIAGNHPLLLIPSAYFFSHVTMGADLLRILGRFSLPLDSIIMAFIFLLVTSGRRKNV